MEESKVTISTIVTMAVTVSSPKARFNVLKVFESLELPNGYILYGDRIHKELKMRDDNVATRLSANVISVVTPNWRPQVYVHPDYMLLEPSDKTSVDGKTVIKVTHFDPSDYKTASKGKHIPNGVLDSSDLMEIAAFIESGFAKRVIEREYAANNKRTHLTAKLSGLLAQNNAKVLSVVKRLIGATIAQDEAAIVQLATKMVELL
jgi:hypothetical protein